MFTAKEVQRKEYDRWKSVYMSNAISHRVVKNSELDFYEQYILGFFKGVEILQTN